MTTRTFCIIQHGEKQQSRADPGLTDRGYRQAGAVAAALQDVHVSRICASPLLRARQTAGPLAERSGLPVHIDADLTERMNWSPEVGTLDDFLAQWRRATEDPEHQPSTGDSSRRAGERFAGALRRFAAAGQEGTVVVVSHGGVTGDFSRGSVTDAAWSARIEELRRQGVPGGAITEVSLVGGAWQLHRVADLGHVPEADRSGHRPD